MKKFKHFVKMELRNWSFGEIISLILIYLIIAVNAVIFKDSLVAIISAACGIMYTFLAGKGKISCYLFGLMGSGLYAFLAFKNALYGNLVLYLAYYIPMQILGIFKWKNHLYRWTNEIVKTKLDMDEWLNVLIALLMTGCGAIFLLKVLHDSSPVIDATTTVLSLFGMYLTVKRCIEQWMIWTVVNGLSIIMWLKVALHGEKVYSTIFMWVVYFILGIYFYHKWKDELEKE